MAVCPGFLLCVGAMLHFRQGAARDAGNPSFMNIQQAVESSFKRTSYLLWEKGSLRRWLALGLLGSMASGGTPSFNFNLPSELSPDKLGVPDGAFWGALAVVALIVLAFLLVIWYLGCVARFVFLENVVFDRHSILEPAFRLRKLGAKLFGFYFLIYLGLLLLFFAGAAGVGGVVYALRDSEAAAGVGLVMSIVCGAFLLFALLFALLIFNHVCDELVVPVMYRDDCGPVAGWRRVAGLLGGHKSDFLIWILVRLVLGVIATLLTLVLALACLLLSGMVVALFAIPVAVVAQPDLDSGPGVALIVAGVLAFLALFLPLALTVSSPAAVCCKSFSLYWLQQIDDETQMLPVSGRLTVESESVAELVDPGFSPALAE